ncbi:hypothetical protein, partial [Bacteroides caccae]
KNRLTLANSGGRFCYEVTNYRVDKFSFSDKLLLTFFFFYSDFNADICPCQSSRRWCGPVSLGYWLE